MLVSVAFYRVKGDALNRDKRLQGVGIFAGSSI